VRLPFGLNLTRTKAAVPNASASLASLSTPYGSSRGWYPIIREAFTGAWQRNVVVNQADVLTYSTVWACITLVASDLSKLWIKLVEKDADGICTETENSAYSPVLRKPNHYQTRVKFIECWIISKLVFGNTYVLKERNNRGGTENGNVVGLYILDPSLVQVLVGADGSVYYSVGQDNLSGVYDDSAPAFPASEIIHDLMVPLYHPLVGVSPIHACGLAAMQGLKIQNNSSSLFESGTTLSGVLTTPHSIPPDAQERLERQWAEQYQGPNNVGKVAILGDDFKFTPMMMTAVDAQLIDQLKWGSEAVCACFHVPGFLVGVGAPPPYTDIQSMLLQYYSTALQALIENVEVLLQEGLEMPKQYGVEFDLKALLRMDTKTQVDNATKGILGGLWKPNEARADFDLKPVPGGDTVYLQQQQYSLEALNRRDQMAPAPPTPELTPAGPEPAPPKAFEPDHVPDHLIEDVTESIFRRAMAA